jgi:hypothetical protein
MRWIVGKKTTLIRKWPTQQNMKNISDRMLDVCAVTVNSFEDFIKQILYMSDGKNSCYMWFLYSEIILSSESNANCKRIESRTVFFTCSVSGLHGSMQKRRKYIFCSMYTRYVNFRELNETCATNFLSCRLLQK